MELPRLILFKWAAFSGTTIIITATEFKKHLETPGFLFSWSEALIIDGIVQYEALQWAAGGEVKDQGGAQYCILATALDLPHDAQIEPQHEHNVLKEHYTLDMVFYLWLVEVFCINMFRYNVHYLLGYF